MSVAPPLPDAASARVHRTPSNSARHAAAQPSSGRSHAHSNGHSAAPSTARRDFETAGAPAPADSGRSASRDRGTTTQYPTRSDSLRAGPTQGSGSGHRERRYASIDATSSHGPAPPPGPPTNGMAADHRGAGVAPAPRKRTYVTCSTGTWMLGKTIGQGSMGKVKLAKNQDTGEQVSLAHRLLHSLTVLGCRQDRSPPVYR
jgi:hypothetical protein